LLVLVSMVAGVFWAQSGSAPAPAPPEQPLPYSHKTHLGLGLKCANCHTNPDPGEAMGFPETAKCMQCHTAVKKESSAIQKLAAFHEKKQPVPWVRVYQIPSYVLFSHKAHVDAGATCETCHGPVAQRDVLWRETNISMGGCMDCHQKKQVSNDCGFCHEAKD
jgi:Zn ribbon nucleic-acid-binding protein